RYMVRNKGDADLIRLVLFDPLTKKEEVVDSDPDKQVDFNGGIFSEKTGELVGTIYIGDTQRIYFRDKDFAADFELVKQKLPGKQVTLAGSTSDERKWMIVVSDDTEPGERHVFDRGTKVLSKQYQVFEK